MRHPMATIPREAMWHHIVHYAPEILLDGPLALEESAAQPSDEADAARLLGAYQAAMTHERDNVPAERRPTTGIWLMIQNEFHGELLSLLAGKDPAKLAAYLQNGLRRDVAYGVGPGTVMLEAMRGDEALRRHFVLMIWDHLVSVAVAVGALAHENPEQGRWGQNLRLPIAEVTRAIEAAIGAPITRPAIAGLFGLEAAPGEIVDIRVPDDAYSAWRLASLMKMSGRHRICEIGAGFGGTAFQMSRLWTALPRTPDGATPSYKIVDLPSMNVVQGWFLMKALGGERVALFGEQPAAGAIDILPYWAFTDRQHAFDLVFNRDSLPEMPEARARDYLAEIEARRCALLSINHDGEATAEAAGVNQLNLPRLMRSYPGMWSAARHIYWARKGYIEELYLPTP